MVTAHMSNYGEMRGQNYSRCGCRLFEIESHAPYGPEREHSHMADTDTYRRRNCDRCGRVRGASDWLRRGPRRCSSFLAYDENGRRQCSEFLGSCPPSGYRSPDCYG